MSIISATALSIFLYHGFVKNIPRDLDEAATIDGCNTFQTFWYIIFPLLKPITVTVAILNLVAIWNDYLLPYLVLDRTKGYQTLPILINSAFTGSYGHVDNGSMFASVLLTIIPIIIVYLFGQKHIIKGIAAGAVKG